MSSSCGTHFQKWSRLDFDFLGVDIKRKEKRRQKHCTREYGRLSKRKSCLDCLTLSVPYFSFLTAIHFLVYWTREFGVRTIEFPLADKLVFSPYLFAR